MPRGDTPLEPLTQSKRKHPFKNPWVQTGLAAIVGGVFTAGTAALALPVVVSELLEAPLLEGAVCSALLFAGIRGLGTMFDSPFRWSRLLGIPGLVMGLVSGVYALGIYTNAKNAFNTQLINEFKKAANIQPLDRAIWVGTGNEIKLSDVPSTLIDTYHLMRGEPIENKRAAYNASPQVVKISKGPLDMGEGLRQAEKEITSNNLPREKEKRNIIVHLGDKVEVPVEIFVSSRQDFPSYNLDGGKSLQCATEAYVDYTFEYWPKHIERQVARLFGASADEATTKRDWTLVEVFYPSVMIAGKKSCSLLSPNQ